MITRRRLAVFLVVVWLGALPVAIWFIRPTSDQSRLRRAYRPHRQKIEETIKRLEHETPQELVNALKAPSTYEYPGVRSLDFDPQNQFEWVLSSRTTLKLLADVGQLAPEHARRRAQSISQQMLAVHQGAIQRALNHIEDPKAPENTQSMRSSQLGQCCALFFLARFSDPKTVLEELLAIEQFSQECQARISGNDAYPESFLRFVKRYFEPDNAFKLNVLTYAIECDETISGREKERLRKELAPLGRKEVVLTAWDAETTSYDVRHMLERIPIDTSKGTTTIVLYEWPYEYEEAKQKETIKIVANLIQTHGT